MKTPTNLDEARRAWEQAEGPNALTAGYLLLTATLRWKANTMSDETYSKIVTTVARDLIQQGAPIE